ncbi:glutathione S-transferase T3-like [Brassica rapa]|uniref:glutathione S-transferase T3-like n=1 Tax=Brassica napus TaxID=3708 RepID=UPI00142DB642|nr:glutathione S-transferase T3-like [Brassica napus]XP_033148485.1 glutathione S-transferase T3-like [Brassica rapa]XP_048596557.1 glutathione S-transferase T3-like [Brassica napus]
MDSDPYRQSTNYVDLLTSQHGVFGSSSQVPVFGTERAEASSVPQDTTAERKERRMWTPVEDMVLISSWLNTSKDPVVGNEQRSGAFWNRIATYFAASPKIAATEQRESTHCKQRWHKINDQVNKFCGSFEAATREKTSGQNENDVLNRAHEIFFTNHRKKFILEHAWKELRNDQKWCATATSKNEGNTKRRKLDEGSQSDNSHAPQTATEEERPPGVKAAKGKNKKNAKGEETLSQFQTMWEIKQKDLVSKDRITKMRLLDRLLAKQEPLDEVENDLRKKLMYELLSN